MSNRLTKQEKIKRIMTYVIQLPYFKTYEQTKRHEETIQRMLEDWIN